LLAEVQLLAFPSHVDDHFKQKKIEMEISVNRMYPLIYHFVNYSRISLSRYTNILVGDLLLVLLPRFHLVNSQHLSEYTCDWLSAWS